LVEIVKGVKEDKDVKRVNNNIFYLLKPFNFFNLFNLPNHFCGFNQDSGFC